MGKTLIWGATQDQLGTTEIVIIESNFILIP